MCTSNNGYWSISAETTQIKSCYVLGFDDVDKCLPKPHCCLEENDIDLLKETYRRWRTIAISSNHPNLKFNSNFG